MSTSTLALFLVCVLAPAAAGQAGAAPLEGPQFLINELTSGHQGNPEVAGDGSGSEFLVVWGGDSEPLGRRFAAADAAPLTGDFVVNSFTTGSQGMPVAGFRPDGDFVISWSSSESPGTDTSYSSIQVGRYDSDGSQVGELQVNTDLPDYQMEPALAVESSGEFLVVWSSWVDFNRCCIRARKFDSDGAPLGDEIEVSTEEFGRNRYEPRAAFGPNGEALVVWASDGSTGSDTSSWSIQGRRYRPFGVALGEEFQINSHTPGMQRHPAVGVSPSGEAVVAWTSATSPGTDDSSFSIQAQRFLNGQPVGEPWQVNTYTTGGQSSPALAFSPEGDFVVTWASSGSFGSDSDLSSIQARWFDSDGQALGPEFQVNSYTNSFQDRASIAAVGPGRFVVAWQSDGGVSDTSDASIQGQILAFSLFADNFETGDLSEWSSQSP